MNQNRTATIRDVAKLAGVSESTVSRVLSGVETQIQISGETRETVQRVGARSGLSPTSRRACAEREELVFVGPHRA